jgi:6-phosphogluconolactonase
MNNRSEDVKIKTMLVGTYTDGESEGIYQVDFDLNHGEFLSEPMLVTKMTHPSFLTLNETGEWLFAVSETANGSLYAFSKDASGWDRSSMVSSSGSAPCYVSVRDDSKYITLANYMSGNTMVYSFDDGIIGTKTYNRMHQGDLGPNRERQEAPHAHYANFIDGRIYAADLGLDEVKVMTIDTTVQSPKVALRMQPGDGPRHLCKHPFENWLFIINELSNTVVSSQIQEDGSLLILDRKSTLPEGYESPSQAADIHISNDGKFLYVSNRGHNSLSAFEISGNASMELIQTIPVEGNWPRNFTISPDGRWVLVANQLSGNITVFKRDHETGKLKYTGTQKAIDSPTCLLFE